MALPGMISPFPFFRGLCWYKPSGDKRSCFLFPAVSGVCFLRPRFLPNLSVLTEFIQLPVAYLHRYRSQSGWIDVWQLSPCFLRTLQLLWLLWFFLCKGRGSPCSASTTALFLHKNPTLFPHFLLHARWWLKKKWSFRFFLVIPCIWALTLPTSGLQRKNYKSSQSF